MGIQLGAQDVERDDVGQDVGDQDLLVREVQRARHGGCQGPEIGLAKLHAFHPQLALVEQVESQTVMSTSGTADPHGDRIQPTLLEVLGQ